jgi:fructose-1,6-bisphosphatase/inositol monophosphatase family enzyme
VGTSTLFGWDYLAGMLICSEAGAVTKERDGIDVVVRDATTRRPIVAATQALCDQLSAKTDM